jgi:hypothetical protein
MVYLLVHIIKKKQKQQKNIEIALKVRDSLHFGYTLAHFSTREKVNAKAKFKLNVNVIFFKGSFFQYLVV